jgi:hypothetical protein
MKYSKKTKILSRPTRVGDMNFDDLSDDITDDLDRKIGQFLKRRTRALSEL